jgi:hypothetical protein
MQDALLAIAWLLTTRRGIALLPASIRSNTAGALEDRKLIELRLIDGEQKWRLTPDGWAEVERIEVERDIASAPMREAARRVLAEIDDTEREASRITAERAPEKSVGGVLMEQLRAMAAEDRAVELEFAALPVVPGYVWRWFNPQGGLPESHRVVQLMYADGRSPLSPAALLRRNTDGSWRAERGPAWGMAAAIDLGSAPILGSFSGRVTMAMCAEAVAAEADVRGQREARAQLEHEARIAADADEAMLNGESERLRTHRAAVRAAIAGDPLPATSNAARLREASDVAMMNNAVTLPATVGKLCKVKRSSAGHRAKWRKSGRRS